jgi:hypothetical protein
MAREIHVNGLTLRKLVQKLYSGHRKKHKLIPSPNKWIWAKKQFFGQFSLYKLGKQKLEEHRVVTAIENSKCNSVLNIEILMQIYLAETVVSRSFEKKNHLFFCVPRWWFPKTPSDFRVCFGALIEIRLDVLLISAFPVFSLMFSIVFCPFEFESFRRLDFGPPGTEIWS